MKQYRFVFLVVVLLTSASAHAQNLTTTPLSVDGNGMGGVGATLISSNALAVTANPAQAGMLSLNSVLNAAAYIQKPSRLPSASFTDAGLSASAANLGVDLRRFLKIPFDIGIGVGYSKESLEARDFNVPEPDGSLMHAPNGERMETVSIGLGFRWLVDFALGYTSKKLDVQQLQREPNGYLAPFDPGATAHDWGTMLRIPVIKIVSTLDQRDLMITPKLKPLVDITASLAKRNIGGSIPSFLYGDTLPLPRQAVAGLAVNLGLTTTVDGKRWELLSLTVARQAEDFLVNYATFSQPAPFPGYGSGYVYQSGFGDLQLLDNLILGRSNGTVTLIKGWQVGIGELLYVRGGAHYPPGQYSYTTFGGTIKLNGLLKLLAAYHLADFNYGALAFLFNHLNVEYDYCMYTNTSDAAMSGATFQDLNLVIK